MSQPNDFLCLRKRMLSFGYFDIHIKKNGDGYFVSACEPLGGYRITIFTKGADHLFRKSRHYKVYRPASKPFCPLTFPLSGLPSSVVTFIGGDRGLAKPRKR